jgi:GntR family transcriptional regulator
MLNKNSRIPLYAQLMDILIKKIKNKMEENEKIPSEREMCEIYDVSRTTVRQAISELEREGYIYRKHGKGTFVLSQKVNQNLECFYSFTEEMKKLGKVPSSKVIKFEILKISNDIIDKMEVKKGDLFYKFTRLRLADGEPMMLETTYVPYNIFPGITKENLNTTALYSIFRDSFNIRVEYAKEIFLPVLANEVEAKYVNVEVGSPSLKITRYSFDKFNKIIEYTVSLARGDRFNYNLMLLR